MKVISTGRGEDCHIIFPDNVISRRHAILKIYATGKMEIVDMGQNGTFVNGVKLTPNTPYPVSRKDVVSFAHVRQLDWTQVPDQSRWYRYAMYGAVGVVLIAGIIFFLKKTEGKSDIEFVSEPLPECQTPVKTPVAEEAEKEKTESGDGSLVKQEEKQGKKNIPNFFPSVKKKKEGERKQETPKDSSEKKAEDNSNSIIMF